MKSNMETAKSSIGRIEHEIEELQDENVELLSKYDHVECSHCNDETDIKVFHAKPNDNWWYEV